MSPRSRMFKTLGCLVAAMTATTALLGWMDPSKRWPLNDVQRRIIVESARSAVLDSVAIRSSYWREVEIIGQPTSPLGESALTATREDTATHFYVEEDGRVIRGPQWRAQHDVPGAPRTIRIGLDQEPNATVSPAQRLCVQALIEALAEGIPRATRALPVRTTKTVRQALGSKQPGSSG